MPFRTDMVLEVPFNLVAGTGADAGMYVFYSEAFDTAGITELRVCAGGPAVQYLNLEYSSDGTSWPVRENAILSGNGVVASFRPSGRYARVVLLCQISSTVTGSLFARRMS